MENNELWKKWHFFLFFVAWNQNLTSESDLTHHFGYKTHVFRLDTAFLKQIKMSHHPLSLFLVYFRFFGHFRLPVKSQTTLSTRTRHFPITCEKPFSSSQIFGPWSGPPFLAILKKLPEDQKNLTFDPKWVVNLVVLEVQSNDDSSNRIVQSERADGWWENLCSQSRPAHVGQANFTEKSLPKNRLQAKRNSFKY